MSESLFPDVHRQLLEHLSETCEEWEDLRRIVPELAGWSVAEVACPSVEREAEDPRVEGWIRFRDGKKYGISFDMRGLVVSD